MYKSAGKSLSRFLLYLIITTVSTLGVEAQGKQSANVHTGKKPGWIVLNNNEISGLIPKENVSGGYYYLLLDHQENISSQTNYFHYVIEIVNSDGVQNMSDINIDFDPSFQSITLHEINIYRDGTKTDAMKNHEMKIIQRETEMDRFLYDGSLTAVVNLKGVREGDIIEYSYSRQGYNPIYNGNYFNTYYLDFDFPVKKIYTRIVCPGNRKISLNYPQKKTEPKIISNTKSTEYVWEKSDVKALLYDNNIPEWYDQNERIEMTTFSSWSEVVNLSLKNFEVDGAFKKSFRNKLKNILKDGPKDTILNQAIRFVQDKIRYLGFESGLNAYKPHHPDQVLESRFGDCKDKSLLLCTILRAFDIEAYPMLVNSNKLMNEYRNFPSPDLFNHCVVQILSGNKVYYIDPTISNQGGSFDKCYFPAYGYGLVIKAGTEELTALPDVIDSKSQVNNTFIITAMNKPAVLKVVTTTSGYYADYQRSYFSGNSTDVIGRNFLKFYSNVYPSVRIRKPVKYTDDRNKNIFTFEEEYEIDTLWTASKGEKDILKFTAYPMTIHGLVDIPGSPKRTMPYRITYPANYREDTKILLPEEWNISNDEFKLKDENFEYSFESSYRNKTIYLSYSYKNNRDYVPAEAFNTYYAKHQEILNNLDYALTYNTTANGRFKFSGIVGLLALLIVITGTCFARKIYLHYNYAPVFTTGEGAQIGGWLILVAVILIISPLRIIYDLCSDPGYFDQKTWKMLLQISSPANLILTAITFIRFIYQILLIIYLGLLIFLFFERRTILPRLIIILLLVNVSFRMIDMVIVLLANSASYTDTDRTRLFTEITRSFIAAAVFVPYFNVSQRVKNTFTRVLYRDQEDQ